MAAIILDQALARKLDELSAPVELCDPSGKVLGLFSPRIDLSEWEPVSPGASDEELARRAQSRGPWYTTEEVLEHLAFLLPPES
jgi:hypothetical protein